MAVRRGCWVRWGGAAALGFVVAGVTEPALACSEPVAGWHHEGRARGAANGVVSLSIFCGADCASAPDAADFVVHGPSGEEVAGTVAVFDGIQRQFVFKPDAPLREGEPYRVTVVGARNLNLVPFADSAELVPTAPIAWRQMPGVTDRVVAHESPTGQELCCPERLDSCGDPMCFPLETERLPKVVVGWDAAQITAAEQNQYEYRVMRTGAPEPAWSYPFHAVVAMSEAEDSICYELELRRVVDGVVHRYPERCIERPANFGEVGIISEDPEEVAKRCDIGSGNTGGAGGVATGGMSTTGGALGGSGPSGGAGPRGGASSSGSGGSVGSDDDGLSEGCSLAIHRPGSTSVAFGDAALGTLLLLTRRRQKR